MGWVLRPRPELPARYKPGIITLITSSLPTSVCAWKLSVDYGPTERAAVTHPVSDAEDKEADPLAPAVARGALWREVYFCSP